MTFKEKLNSQIEARKSNLEFLKRAADESAIDEEKEAYKETIEAIKKELEQLEEMLKEVDEPAEDQNTASRSFNPLSAMDMRGASLDLGGNFAKGGKKMTNSEEIRSFQKFIASGGRNMTEAEARALNINGAAAVLPVEIFNGLITETKYSDLLHRAKIFNEGGAGKLNIPIASGNEASWHTELADGTEASPTLTKIELGGFELMRLMKMSAAVDSMTEASFKENVMQLLSAEVIDTLEKAFISGTGSGQPTGLSNLTWNSNNSITTNPGIPIDFSYIAQGIGKLPQKYARGAILLMNTKTNCDLMRSVDDNAQPVYSIATPVETMFGHEIVISEHCPDNTVFIIDPAELYVRFAMPVQLEIDKSSGFTSASVYLRALTVVDAAWNTKAAVKVAQGAAAAE